jgi:transcriptional regulator NrdR family protein
LTTEVVMTKPDLRRISVVRRRHCERCDHRFYTAQLPEQIVNVKWTGGGSNSIPMVVQP